MRNIVKLRHKNCIPRWYLFGDTKSSQIWLWDQTSWKKYHNIFFFSLLFYYLSLPFSYLGYILGLGLGGRFGCPGEERISSLLYKGMCRTPLAPMSNREDILSSLGLPLSSRSMPPLGDALGIRNYPLLQCILNKKKVERDRKKWETKREYYGILWKFLIPKSI